MPKKKRNYRAEYDNYQGTAEQKKNRAKRNKARRQAIADGRAKKGDGKDIDHKKPLRSGGSNEKSNHRVRDKSSNRSDNGHHKGEKQKRKKK